MSDIQKKFYVDVIADVLLDSPAAAEFIHQRLTDCVRKEIDARPAGVWFRFSVEMVEDKTESGDE